MRIEVKPAVKCTEEMSCFFTFKFKWEIINKIREMPIKYYNKNTRTWEFPLSHLSQLLENFPHAILVNSDRFKPRKKKLIPKHNKDLKNFKFKTKPFKHQIDAFNYGLSQDKWLLGDEMGLGKTKVAIDLASVFKETENLKHTLIVCGVNSIKYNWLNEIKIHSYNSGLVIDGSNAERAELLASKPEEYFYIINIEALRNKEVLEQILKLIKDKTIEFVIIDEIHKAKNPNTLQGKGIKKLRSKYRLALTGTPLMNSPEDVYIILNWLDVEKHNYYQFKKFYCIFGGYGNYQVVGYKNLNRLSTTLDNTMLRRLKADELDLPPKIRQTDYVEMSVRQKMIYDEVLQGIKANIDQVKLSPNPLAMLTRLRQVTGAPEIVSSHVKDSAKIDRLKELVLEITSSDQKAIIYSNWTSVTDILVREFAHHSPAVITGKVKDRQTEVNRFQNDDNCKLMIATIGSAGTGLTLTAASYVIFMDKPWNPATAEQAEDRAHRIGTKGAVNVITLACKDTIDEKIEEILESKENLFDAIVNNKKAKIQIIEQLLG